MWELSSPGEAAKAVALAAFQRLTYRFRSLAGARQLPQEICGVGGVSVVLASAVFSRDEDQMWELSSPSEAAKAAALAAFSAPDLPLSQPR